MYSVTDIITVCGELFGVSIAPNNDVGKILLCKLSGMPVGTPFLETEPRNLKKV